jgi:hypothetical protein
MRRGGIGGNGLTAEHESAAAASHAQIEVEAGPEIEFIERARLSRPGGAPQRDVETRARCDIAHRHGRGNQRGGAAAVHRPHSGAGKHVFERIPLRQSRHQREAGPFGRGGDRHDGAGGPHALAHLGAQGQGLESLAAPFIASGRIHMGGNGGLDRGVPRQKGQSKTDPTQHHRHAAPPMRRADILGQIGGEVEAFQPFAQSGKAAGAGHAKR